jgi:redox-sensitive bicupin YhaK (pirin superfamily)
MHSEFNPLPDTETHMLQIWIEPEVAGIAPEYEERGFSDAQKRGRLQALVSADGIDGSMKIHQDARLYSGLFDGAESAALDLAAGRRAWVHVARGSVLVNGTELSAGDAAAITDESRVELSGGKNAEVLVFDLA